MRRVLFLLFVLMGADIGCEKSSPLEPSGIQRSLVGSWLMVSVNRVFASETRITTSLSFLPNGDYYMSKTTFFVNESITETTPRHKWGTYSIAGNVVSVVATDTLTATDPSNSIVPGKTYSASFSFADDREGTMFLQNLDGENAFILPAGKYVPG